MAALGTAYWEAKDTLRRNKIDAEQKILFLFPLDESYHNIVVRLIGLLNVLCNIL